MHSQHVFSQQPEIMHGKKAWHSNECPSDNTLLKSYTWDLHVYKLKTVSKAASYRVKRLCFSLGLSCSTASAWWCGLTCLSLLGTGNALLSIGTVALQLLCDPHLALLSAGLLHQRWINSNEYAADKEVSDSGSAALVCLGQTQRSSWGTAVLCKAALVSEQQELVTEAQLRADVALHSAETPTILMSTPPQWISAKQ